MIEWITVISLIVFGILLVITEIIFVPGTTIVGIIGLICLGMGIYQSFEYFSSNIAYSILGGTSILFGALMYYVFTTKLWERFSLKDQINSKFNEGKTDTLNIGDIGTTLSTLKPIGNAEFDGKVFEVKSLGEYVDSNTSVEILKIDKNQIIIKPINK